MPFEFIKLPELDFDLQSVTTESGRKYTTPTGNVYPSITTVLSSYNRDAILQWRKSVGEEVANKISAKASSRGTKLHKICEDYLLNDLSPLKMHSMMPDLKERFLVIRPHLDKFVGKLYGIEQALYSDNLKLAGRCDCIGEWNGKISIIDWKTSSKLKNKDDILNYFMQATAYAEMFEEITKIEINQIVVAIVVEGENNPQIFVEDKVNYLPHLHKYIQDFYSNK